MSATVAARLAGCWGLIDAAFRFHLAAYRKHHRIDEPATCRVQSQKTN